MSCMQVLEANRILTTSSANRDGQHRFGTQSAIADCLRTQKLAHIDTSQVAKLIAPLSMVGGRGEKNSRSPQQSRSKTDYLPSMAAYFVGDAQDGAFP